MLHWIGYSHQMYFRFITPQTVGEEDVYYNRQPVLLTLCTIPTACKSYYGSNYVFVVDILYFTADSFDDFSLVRN